MRQRIHNLTGDNDTGYISTFHSFCVSVLQEDSHALQYPKSFLVLDNSDIDSMLKIIYEERGLTLRNMTFSKARDMIEIRKLIKEPEYYLDMLNMSLDTLRQKYLTATEPSDIIFYGYLYQEKKCFGLDYNDLIKFTLYIFEQNEAVKIKWQQRLEYIMIDEFQDTDPIQYSIFKHLFLDDPEGSKPVIFVGDPKQSIYRFRNASLETYLLAKNEINNLYQLVKNYRSTPGIIAGVNEYFNPEGKGPDGGFLNQALTYSPVQFNKKKLPLLLEKNGKLEPLPSFAFWSNADTKALSNAEALRDMEAIAIAEEIES